GVPSEPGEGEEVTRAVVYVRVSSKEQAETGYSMDAQKEACLRYVADRGWELGGVFTDRGESARTADRPEFQSMLDQLDADRSIKVVLVHQLDRFARNIEDHVLVKARLRKLGVRLLSVVEGFDESPSGQLIEGVMAAVAAWYSQNLGQETKKGLVEKVRAGWWPTKAPVGYLNVRE